MNKTLKSGIMATFVALTLTGCEQEERVDVLSARSIDECVAAGMDFPYCEMQFKVAQEMHQDVAPKFEDNTQCSAQFGDSCTRQEIKNSDGTTTSMWMPMMMGYMMGNISSNINNAQASSRPLYMSDARRDKDGSMRGHMVTASGNGAAFGKSSLSRSTATARPGVATVSSTRAAVSTRGGFSASARGSSAS
ncbi:MAG: DUF1190 domain-containing protein [Bacilli bacterium]